MKNNIAYIIPAHNEAPVIAKTIQSLLLLTEKEHIYVVSDGSTDATAQVASYATPHVLQLEKAQGKANAINIAIQHFNLHNRYEYIMPMDADTVITREFVSHALPILEADIKNEIACVVGKVVSHVHNWVTLYRLWEYEISQTIHKASQSAEDAIIVCPGCATIYRSHLFDFNLIPTGTLAEDMDFTFLIHRKHLGKIKYIPDAKVVTQDPATVKDYLRQIDRWYTGFWQCIIKHNIPWEGQMLDLEVMALALEGLFNGLLIFAFLFLLPLTLVRHPLVLAIPFAVDFFFFLIPTLAFTAIRHRVWQIFLYLPLFYFMRAASSLTLLVCFIKVVLAHDVQMRWSKMNRY